MTIHWPAIFIPVGLCVFHVGITTLALYRACGALQIAREEGREDPRTLWRLTGVRTCAVLSVLSAAMVGCVPPLLMMIGIMIGPVAGLRGYEDLLHVTTVAAWPVWIVSTVALDNFARRWRRSEPGARITAK